MCVSGCMLLAASEKAFVTVVLFGSRLLSLTAPILPFSFNVIDT